MVCHIQMVSYKPSSILINTRRAILLFIFRYGLIYEVRHLARLQNRSPSCINELIFILIIFWEIFYLCEIFNAVGAFMRI